MTGTHLCPGRLTGILIDLSSSLNRSPAEVVENGLEHLGLEQQEDERVDDQGLLNVGIRARFAVRL